MSRLLDRLCLRTAGESHGPAMVAVLEGIPRGLTLDFDAVNHALRRRQGGAGRGGRQNIERDEVEVLGGMRKGRTIGSPLCLVVRNRDHKIDELPEPTRPRPGHADLAGCARYLDHDIRGNLERASARETAARVAAGAVATQVLAACGVSVFSFVRSVGSARLPEAVPGALTGSLQRLIDTRDATRLYTLDESTDAAMMEVLADAGRNQDTAGGEVEVQVVDMLIGAGSSLQWHERLDARLAAAVMSIQAFKGVEVGLGFECSSRPGSQVHDEILPAVDGGFPGRATNNAGGLEGGMTNGQPVVVRGAMKPISTLRKPLRSVDLKTGAAAEAGFERSDLCAVSAASVVAEAMVALVLCDAVLNRVGGETLEQVVERFHAHQQAAAALMRGE